MSEPTISYWETLDISFEGFFMCRLTTDPDPTDEKRGVSGYTLALATESDLDNWIQLNPSEAYLRKNLREPLRSLLLQDAPAEPDALPGQGRPINSPIDQGTSPAQPDSAKPTLKAALFDSPLGVRVTSVQVAGKSLPAGHPLLGAKVNLAVDRERQAVPMFHGRNDVLGSDDNILFPIDPFIITFTRDDGGSEQTLIERKDVLPGDQPIWSLPEQTYRYRVGKEGPQSAQSMEVMEAIGVYDFYEYFRNRAEYLTQQCERCAEGSAEREMYKTRLYAIEFFGDRIRSRLGLQRLWDFSIQGSAGRIGGFPEAETIDTSAPWPINFWFGGFDGDLLIGYMRGKLQLPRRL